MLRKHFAILLLFATPCQAATHTVYYAAATGSTLYAYPASQSLADWTTYRVSLTEDSGANIGRYTGSVDDANGATWYLFSGTSQPSSWGDALAATSVIRKANVIQVSDDATAADNLESAADNYSATRGLAGTALPNAAADAAGGLAISDAGGLDLDAILADTAELQGLFTTGGTLRLLFPGSTIAAASDVSAIGTASDRSLRPPADAFIFRVARRSDGTYTTDRTLRLRPGTTESIRIGLDMSRLTPRQFVYSVGTPSVSAGSLTATSPERYDELATYVVGGTATASESRTIDVTVTMEQGDVFNVTLPVEVFAD